MEINALRKIGKELGLENCVQGLSNMQGLLNAPELSEYHIQEFNIEMTGLNHSYVSHDLKHQPDGREIVQPMLHRIIGLSPLYIKKCSLTLQHPDQAYRMRTSLYDDAFGDGAGWKMTFSLFAQRPEHFPSKRSDLAQIHDALTKRLLYPLKL